MSQKGTIITTKLFVGKLSFDTTDASLLELFKTYGEVVSATVLKDRVTDRSRGFGFVELSDLKSAQNAIKELDGKEFEGQTIIVNAANPPRPTNDHTNRSGGYRRGR
jgi:RNA recognition motif-containing protein